MVQHRPPPIAHGCAGVVLDRSRLRPLKKRE